MLFQSSLGGARIAGRGSGGGGRRGDMSGGKAKGNVAVGGVFPGPATLLLGDTRGRRRSVVGDSERLRGRLRMRGEGESSGGGGHDVSGGIRADH